ncbi:MFS transporter [Cerasicoccus arenae]|uniref:MFS transporter n=1 Tax=Cerasicoccus arenae TaxID=424488 RepID=A0A8J3DB31_9BACT|nr:MFS transporter [Cerasicoccus arenae]MBK1856733.1 MFS transporter [Cerasicoccus arenae]GHB99180.1 hypothetical protein GCM10007047_14150 [Cerasicoccus arenae]
MSRQTDNATTTYLYDRLRAPFQGICDAGWITFALLIVIRGYGADQGTVADLIKGLITASSFIGLLLTAVCIALVGKTGWRATSIVSVYLSIAGVLLLASALVNSLIAFTLLFVVASIIFNQQAPMMIRAYSSNYSPTERGQKVSTVLVIVAGCGAVYSFLGGRLLDWNFNLYPLILIVIAISCFISASLIHRIPSEPLTQAETGNPFRSFSLIWKDKLFGWLLMSWALMGFANIMTIPIRVEILANPDYGINASNEQIALATFIIPAVARVLSGKVWGALFDRMNFILWRICVNSCFFIGLLLFFSGMNLPVIYLGATFIGLGMGGGMIGWNLWVTKIAPLEKVSAYMSIHTMLTGLRGVIAPFVGYLVLTSFSSQAVGWLAASLVIASSTMFALLWRNDRFRRAA